MAAGSLGVLAGGLPVELAMDALGWRGLFLCLAILSVAAAGVLFFGVRDGGVGKGSESFRALIAGVGHVVAAPAFIRLAPLSVAIQASGLALIALWVGPWLREVAGYTPDSAATIVSLMGVGMIVGYALCAITTNRLVASGVPLARIMIAGYLIYFAVVPVIIMIDPAWAAPVWLIFALCISFGPLSYPVLGALFSGALTGRVHTALNFLVFVTAFALQWAFGVAVEKLTPSLGIDGAYDAALGALVGLQAASFLWYVVKAPARDPLLAE
jgi:predicted MFS family arabinose efflux permease